MANQGAFEILCDGIFAQLAKEDLELRECGSVLYMYRGGAWSILSKRDISKIEKIMHRVGVGDGFPVAKEIRSIWRNIGFRAPELDADLLDDKVLLALPNGTLDPKEKTLETHSPDHMTTRRVNVEYDPKAKCPEWLAMLDRIFEDRTPEEREKIILFLQMYFGMALFGFKRGSPRALRKALILVGESETGKSSIAEVLRELFHRDEVAAENVDQLSKEFGLAKIMSARAIIADDAVKKKSKLDPSVFKKLITGEPLTANPKYRDAIDFRFQGPVVITTNVTPKIDDETDAVFSRAIMLRTVRKFEKADKALLGNMEVVAYLHSVDELPGVLNWAIEGGNMAVELNNYGEMGDTSVATRQWRAENDVVYDFVSRFCAPDAGHYCSVPLLAQIISTFAEEEHHAPKGEYAPKKVSSRLMHEVKASVPGVSVTRYDRGDVSGNVVVGMKVNVEGVLWEARARERGVIASGVKWKLNGKVL